MVSFYADDDLYDKVIYNHTHSLNHLERFKMFQFIDAKLSITRDVTVVPSQTTSKLKQLMFHSKDYGSWSTRPNLVNSPKNQPAQKPTRPITDSPKYGQLAQFPTRPKTDSPKTNSPNY